MAERTIDPQWPVDAADVDEALRVVAAKLRSGELMRHPWPHAIGLAAEVERLRESNAAMATLLRQQGCRNLELVGELARIRAALPEIIGCAHGDALTCPESTFPEWSKCCPVRKRAIDAGLLPQPERRDEPDNSI